MKHLIVLARVAICRLVVTWAATAQAAPAGYLRTIGYDQVLADPTFSALTGTGQAIAVLDTGIDPNHVAFTGQNITGINENSSNLSALAPPDYADGNRHGTFVTSVAAGQPVASTNGVDTSGLAPGADIVAVRVLNNSGSGDFTTIINGLNWVIDQVQNHGGNIRVVNMSLGTTTTFITPPTGQLVDDFNAAVLTLEGMGIPVVAATGNSGSQTGLSFPAILPDIIAVGSATEDGSAVSTFTNRNNALDLLAPGENIHGAYAALSPGDAENLYASGGAGTSFSSPQVAGAILLINERFNDVFGHYPTVSEVLGILTDTGVDVYDPSSGNTYKRLNLYAALQAAPEPMSLVLLLPGCMLLLIVRRRAQRDLAPAKAA